jgi:hypothetical protein
MKEVGNRFNRGGGRLQGAGPGNHWKHHCTYVYVLNSATTYLVTLSLLHPPTNQTVQYRRPSTPKGGNS